MLARAANVKVDGNMQAQSSVVVRSNLPVIDFCPFPPFPIQAEPSSVIRTLRQLTNRQPRGGLTLGKLPTARSLRDLCPTDIAKSNSLGSHLPTESASERKIRSFLDSCLFGTFAEWTESPAGTRISPATLEGTAWRDR